MMVFDDLGLHLPLVMMNPLWRLRSGPLWRRRRRQLRRTHTPGETFIECCSTPAMLLTDVEDDGTLTGVDLASGKQRSCDAFHCGPVALEPATAIAIGLLGDVYDAALGEANEILRNLHPMHPQPMRQVVAEVQLRAGEVSQ